MIIRKASLLAAWLLLCSASCGGNSLLQYRTNGAGQFEAHFVDAADTLVVLEADERFERELRFFAADGTLISESRLEDYVMSPPGSFLLVDRYHVALKRRGSAQYDLAPSVPEPSPVARAVLGWMQEAGGLLEDRLRLSASTNAAADLSCAIGADGSIAVWTPSSNDDFRATPPGAIADPRWTRDGVFCLRADNRPLVMVVGVEAGAITARVFATGEASPEATTPLEFSGRPVTLGSGAYAGADLVVGLAPEVGEAAPAEQPLIATRLEFVDGALRASHARLEGWPQGLGPIAVRRHDILTSQPGVLRGAIRVPWSTGNLSLAFVPEVVRAPDEDFYQNVLRTNLPELSPSGARVLWLDAEGELRLDPAQGEVF